MAILKGCKWLGLFLIFIYHKGFCQRKSAKGTFVIEISPGK